MKRKLIIAIPVVVILLVAGVVLFLIYGTGSAAGDYLNPRLSLGALRYQYPLTAVVDDVRLVADDPAKPGATIDIFVARQVTLTGGNFAAGENHFPLDRLGILWTMADRRGALEKLEMDLLGGRLEGRGQFALKDPMDGRLELRFADLRIEQCLRNADGGEGKYRGDLSGQVEWRGPLTDALKQSRGSGAIQIADGYLNQLPVISTLLAAVNRTMKAAGMGSGRPSDTADMAFTFEGNRVNFSKVFVVTRVAALRGRGDIHFDTRLDMLFNAGAVEKVESMLGKFGAFLGRMSDEISAYTVTGTLDEPKVGFTVAPNL
jgi:hypothetical protein